MTTGQNDAMAMMIFPRAAPPYPKATIAFLGIHRLIQFEANLVNDIAPSAAPSMAPTIAAGAPKTVFKNIGISG
jgi:hypothetical protein